MSAPVRVTVGGRDPYDVVIGRGLLGELSALLHAQDGSRGAVTRVVIIHPLTMRATAEAVRDDLAAGGLDAHVVEVPDGEEQKTVPVAVLTQLVQGDDYQWGALMAGALFGSIPVALLYSFFVEYYVSSLTGAVKE